MMRQAKLAFFSLALVMGGCVGGADSDAILDGDELADELRVASWEKFVGAWEGDVGRLTHIVFTRDAVPGTSGHRYWAEQAVTCVRAPCNPIRVEGSYRATSRYLYLTHDGTTDRFSHTFAGTSEVTLRDGRVVASHLNRVDSFCNTADDCAGQEYGPYLRCHTTNTFCSANKCERRCVGAGVCHSNTDCAAGTYCATQSCGAAGTCQRRPQACIALANPVCGCNGQTYGNACNAASAGQNVAFQGTCEASNCRANSDCAEGYFCSRQGCGTVGTCMTGRTVRCNATVSDPVCGCDGRTYTNWCAALIAQASIAYTGTCTQ